MSIRVKTPDGGAAIFPDGTAPETIEAALQQKFGGPKSDPNAAAEADANRQFLEGNKIAAGGAKALEVHHPTARAIIAPAMETAYTALLGGPALKAAAAGVPGMVGTAARAAMANPRLTGAALLGVPRLLKGDVLGAIEQGGLGYLLGMRGGRGEAIAEAAKLGAPAEAAAAETAVPAAARGVSSSGVVPASVPSPTSVSGLMTAEVPASAEAAAPETVKSLMGTGTATMPTKTANTIIREFAKAAAPAAKKGERIWIRLNSDGLPEDVITPGQASRLASSLKTWVARTW